MIRVWWRPNVDVITRFEDYTGPLADLWPEGARIAWFASGKGMTLPNDTWYEKVHVTP